MMPSNGLTSSVTALHLAEEGAASLTIVSSSSLRQEDGAASPTIVSSSWLRQEDGVAVPTIVSSSSPRQEDGAAVPTIVSSSLLRQEDGAAVPTLVSSSWPRQEDGAAVPTLVSSSSPRQEDLAVSPTIVSSSSPRQEDGAAVPTIVSSPWPRQEDLAVSPTIVSSSLPRQEDDAALYPRAFPRVEFGATSNAIGSNLIEVFIKDLHGHTNVLHLQYHLTVGDVKLRVNEMMGIPTDDQRLIYRGKQLEYDSDTLDSFVVDGDVEFIVTQRILGGQPPPPSPVTPTPVGKEKRKVALSEATDLQALSSPKKTRAGDASSCFSSSSYTSFASSSSSDVTSSSSSSSSSSSPMVLASPVLQAAPATREQEIGWTEEIIAIMPVVSAQVNLLKTDEQFARALSMSMLQLKAAPTLEQKVQVFQGVIRSFLSRMLYDDENNAPRVSTEALEYVLRTNIYCDPTLLQKAFTPGDKVLVEGISCGIGTTVPINGDTSYGGQTRFHRVAAGLRAGTLSQDVVLLITEQFFLYLPDSNEGGFGLQCLVPITAPMKSVSKALLGLLLEAMHHSDSWPIVFWTMRGNDRPQYEFKTADFINDPLLLLRDSSCPLVSTPATKGKKKGSLVLTAVSTNHLGGVGRKSTDVAVNTAPLGIFSKVAEHLSWKNQQSFLTEMEVSSSNSSSSSQAPISTVKGILLEMASVAQQSLQEHAPWLLGAFSTEAAKALFNGDAQRASNLVVSEQFQAKIEQHDAFASEHGGKSFMKLWEDIMWCVENQDVPANTQSVALNSAPSNRYPVPVNAIYVAFPALLEAVRAESKEFEHHNFNKVALENPDFIVQNQVLDQLLSAQRNGGVGGKYESQVSSDKATALVYAVENYFGSAYRRGVDMPWPKLVNLRNNARIAVPKAGRKKGGDALKSIFQGNFGGNEHFNNVVDGGARSYTYRVSPVTHANGKDGTRLPLGEPLIALVMENMLITRHWTYAINQMMYTINVLKEGSANGRELGTNQRHTHTHTQTHTHARIRIYTHI